MNQDNTKSLLLKLEDPKLDFSVIFSGKKSKKVNGLYKPDTREIIIHNKNFQNEAGNQDENALSYTAIHEYAHHLHACKRGGKLPVRAHTSEFWAIFHALLEKAEEKGLYKNNALSSPELSELTERIKKEYLFENGRLLKELGNHLIMAEGLCKNAGIRFEDYIDRILCIPRVSAKTAIKMFQYDIDPEIGPDNMRFVANIGDEDERLTAEKSFLAGKSPDTVKMRYKNISPAEEEDPRLSLEKEKQRIERTISALSKRLGEVVNELENL
jgi:hypothetical protein